MWQKMVISQRSCEILYITSPFRTYAQCIFCILCVQVHRAVIQYAVSSPIVEFTNITVFGRPDDFTQAYEYGKSLQMVQTPFYTCMPRHEVKFKAIQYFDYRKHFFFSNFYCQNKQSVIILYYNKSLCGYLIGHI